MISMNDTQSNEHSKSRLLYGFTFCYTDTRITISNSSLHFRELLQFCPCDHTIILKDSRLAF